MKLQWKHVLLSTLTCGVAFPNAAVGADEAWRPSTTLSKTAGTLAVLRRETVNVPHRNPPEHARPVESGPTLQLTQLTSQPAATNRTGQFKDDGATKTTGPANMPKTIGTSSALPNRDRTALRRCIYRAPRYGPRRFRTVSTPRAPERALRVQALAPEHPGLTINAHPRLYYYLSEAVPQLELTLACYRQPQPLLEVRLTESVGPGMHELDLSKHGVALPFDTEYEWHVAVVRDPKRRSRDVVSRGVIKRIRPDSSLASEIQDEDAWKRPVSFAQAGLWYDALESMVDLRQHHPDDPAVSEGLQSLLSQAKLEAIPID